MAAPPTQQCRARSKHSGCDEESPLLPLFGAGPSALAAVKRWPGAAVGRSLDVPNCSLAYLATKSVVWVGKVGGETKPASALLAAGGLGEAEIVAMIGYIHALAMIHRATIQPSVCAALLAPALQHAAARQRLKRLHGFHRCACLKMSSGCFVCVFVRLNSQSVIMLTSRLPAAGLHA